MTELSNGARQLKTITDGNGVWQIDTANDLHPGLHRVTVENGTTDREFFLFRPTDTYLPTGIFWLLLALVTAAAVLSLYDRRAVAEESATKSALRRRVLRGHIRRAAATAAAMLVVAGLVLVWYRGASQIARVTDDVLTGSIAQQVQKADVEGEVRPLAEGEPVAGLDISAGDTTIRVAEGGRYRFAAINADNGLRLNHPRLLKTVVKSIDGPVTDIPFSVEMFNLLIRIVDAESRGRAEQVVELSDQKIALEISKDLGYQSIFNLDNVPDQELFVGEISKVGAYNSAYGVQYSPVVKVEVANGDKTAAYHFFYQDGKWLFIR
jgi:hypothetical protein